MRDVVEPRIRELIADHLAVDVARLADGISIRDDLAADSLDLAEIASLLELRFGVVLPDRMVERMRSYGDVVDGLVRLIAARADSCDRDDAGEESPQARVRLVEPDSPIRGSRHWAGALTRYMSQTLVQTARQTSRGIRVEILLGAETTVATLDVIRGRFALVGDGVDVTVDRAPGPGFLWTSLPRTMVDTSRRAGVTAGERRK